MYVDRAGLLEPVGRDEDAADHGVALLRLQRRDEARERGLHRLRRRAPRLRERARHVDVEAADRAARLRELHRREGRVGAERERRRPRWRAPTAPASASDGRHDRRRDASSCACRLAGTSRWPGRPSLTRHRVQREQLEGDVRRSQRGRLPRPVVRGRDLDHVGADEPQPAQRPEQRDRLGGREACHLRRSGAWRERGVEKVDVEGEERPAARRPAPAPAPRTPRAPSARSSSLGTTVKPSARASSRSVAREQRPAHSRLDGGGRLDQPLLGRALERRAVEVALVEVLVPGVGVRVELDERHPPVAPRQGAQHGSVIEWSPPRTSGKTPASTSRREPLLDAAVRPLRVPGATGRSPKSATETASRTSIPNEA